MRSIENTLVTLNSSDMEPGILDGLSVQVFWNHIDLPPVLNNSMGNVELMAAQVGQLVLSELEARIPAEHLHHFRQTRARNGNWTGPVEWLRLYDVWRGLVDQYLVLPPAGSTLPAALPLPPPPPPTPAGPQRQQRRARCNSATGQRSVKQPKT